MCAMPSTIGVLGIDDWEARTSRLSRALEQLPNRVLRRDGLHAHSRRHDVTGVPLAEGQRSLQQRRGAGR